jgi:hypothetical protein
LLQWLNELRDDEETWPKFFKSFVEGKGTSCAIVFNLVLGVLQGSIMAPYLKEYNYFDKGPECDLFINVYW